MEFPASFAKHDCARRKFRLRVYDATFDETVVEIVDEEGRQVSHSSVWRWLSWLGSLNDLRERAMQLIFQKDPQADLHWKPHPIAAHKVRSEARRRTLEQAAMTLDMVNAFYHLFAINPFTHLETAGAVR